MKNVKAYVSSVLKATTRKGQNQSSSDKSAFSRMLAKRQGKEKTSASLRCSVVRAELTFPCRHRDQEGCS